jgi:hypothetical protein
LGFFLFEIHYFFSREKTVKTTYPSKPPVEPASRSLIRSGIGFLDKPGLVWWVNVEPAIDAEELSAKEFCCADFFRNERLYHSHASVRAIQSNAKRSMIVELCQLMLSILSALGAKSDFVACYAVGQNPLLILMVILLVVQKQRQSLGRKVRDVVVLEASSGFFALERRAQNDSNYKN